MKKGLVLLAATSMFFAAPTLAQTSSYAPSASRELYNFGKYHAIDLVKYFKELHDSGRKFPTDEEFNQKFGVNVELVRSHVRKRNVLMGDKNLNRLFPSLREGRTVFMNLPTGTETTTGGFPSGQFDNDPYTLWQYVDLWGAWNHGFFQAPGSWADAAHKHGVDMMSGIVFFDTTGNPGGVGSGSYVTEIMRKDAQGYLYTKPLIHLLMYLGLDGINYNWEDGGYLKEKVVNFHKELRNYAKELKFDNYRQAIYTSRSYLSDDYASGWLWDEEKQHHIGDIMLNYASGNFADIQGASGQAAKTKTGSYDHLYSGAWIVTMRRSFQAMETNVNNTTNLCLWGEHANSRFVSNNTGDSSTEKMKNLQHLFERAFSGGSRNPGVKDPWNVDSDWGDQLRSFGGISRMIPERTTLEQKLPFRTYFNTGAGERYYYKGKTASMGGWYNMASQDLQPTYRWLQYRTGTKDAHGDAQVEYIYDDAYMGGTSLRVFGQGGVDVILYRGLLTVSEGNVKASLAFKAEDANKKGNPVSLLLHKQGRPDTEYIVVKYDDLQGASWEEQTKVVAGLSKGDVIDFVGIRIAQSTDQRVYLGEIALMDDRQETIAPLAPINLKAEVKEETQTDLAVMLTWNAQVLPGKTQTRAAHSLLYNDEAGVHHFEILYKEGENGAVRELGRTTSWTTYVPRVSFDKISDESTEQPYFGVRAVSEDLKSYSPITWIKVDRQESVDVPAANRYCKSELNPKSEGAETARRIRYLERVNTTGAKSDLNYTSNAPDGDGDNYVYYTNSGFVVEQGQSIQFFFKAFGDPNQGSSSRDGLQWCWAQTYIDWNNDGVFDALTDEKIDALRLGRAKAATPAFQSTGVTANFTVPADATPGTVRVRIVFTDAWFPLPTPCGVTAKGFTFDFDMKIEGTHPGRPSTDTRDAGTPEQPENLEGSSSSSVETLVEASELPSFYPNPVESKLYVQNAEYAWVYSLDGMLVKSFDATVPADLGELPAGTYVIKLVKNNVTRSYKLIKR